MEDEELKRWLLLTYARPVHCQCMEGMPSMQNMQHRYPGMGMPSMQNMQNMQNRYPGEGEREGERERDQTRESRTVRGGDAGGYRRDNQGQKVNGPSRRNVEINKQITVCQDSRDLCALIDAHAAEFNQAWRLPFESSCRAARGPSRGAGAGSGGHVQLANVANTLWAYATMGREPGAVVMRELDGWAEAQ